jgi:hypothetical protein
VADDRQMAVASARSGAGVVARGGCRRVGAGASPSSRKVCAGRCGPIGFADSCPQNSAAIYAYI